MATLSHCGNVANVEMLPIANTNVANRGLEIGKRELGNGCCFLLAKHR